MLLRLAQELKREEEGNRAMKIKKEIRDDIQSELMSTSEELGGIGHAVAASFMNPFN